MNKDMLIAVITLTLGRTVVNMTRRFAYPFIPEISRQLGVPIASIQTLMATQAGIGITSPLFGPLSERYGRKRVMLGMLVIMTIASAMGALLPQFWIFAGVMIVLGAGKMIFDPAMQAYLGDRIPYNRRGLAIGTTELSWAGSLIIIAPLTGFLLDVSGIQAVFVALTVALLFGVAIVAVYLPSDHPEKGVRTRITTPLAAFRILSRSRAGLGALGFSLLLSMANELFFINYGVWMELSFELVLAALGAVTSVIAAAEVLGEFLVIGISDRIGKRRLALIGALFAGVGYLVLPHLAFSLGGSLVGLFVLFLMFEMSIVSSIPLFTEVLPEARSVMMSGNVGAHSLGRMSGAIIGGLLLTVTNDFALLGVINAMVGVAAFVVLWYFVQE